MIKIKIQEYLKSQAVENAYQLQQILGISPTVAARLWKGDFDKIGINTIDKICWEFDCQPNDLFEFVRQKEGNQAFKSSGIADVRSKWLSRKYEMEREKQLAEIDKEEAGKEDIPPESDNTQSDNTQEDKSYYNTNSLKARGWTDEMIKDLLGDADTKQCGRMRSKSLYLDSRVEAVEKTKEFTDWKTKNKAKETQSNKTQSGKSKTKKKA